MLCEYQVERKKLENKIAHRVIEDCGQAAKRYKMTGEITFTIVQLCTHHIIKMQEKTNYKFTLMNDQTK